MSLPLRVRVFAGLLISAAAAAAIASCSASGNTVPFSNSNQGGAGASQAGSAGTSSAGTNLGGAAGSGGVIQFDSGPEDVVNETPINQCGTQCGSTERCEAQFLGYDDNCNGIVDEGCPCTPGLSHWCFKGDPASRNKGACKDGTEKCTEIGTWGPCLGGFHGDIVDNCLNQGTPVGCHDLTVSPFTEVKLKEGTGTFGQGASGEQFLISCPPSIPAANCPAVQNPNGADATFTPLQSGQYTVTYTKGNGAESCTFSIYVGSGGLRVELNWDHQGEGAVNHYQDAGSSSGGNGPDLDLHVHRPGFKSVWFSGIGFKSDDCFFGNCTAVNFAMNMPGSPNWFLPDQYPHNWTHNDPYDPNDPAYTCYNAPRGSGSQWKMTKKGCHNPRLDLDNITCDNTVTDPQNELFCAPENVNIDEPPYGLWTRIGVHYYGHGYSGDDLHPTVTLICGGAQVAQLGPAGYNAPVAFPASGCGDDDDGNNTFWLVADVMAVQGVCGDVDCVVQPLYADPVTKTPLFSTGGDAKTKFGPACPPTPPDAGGNGCN